MKRFVSFLLTLVLAISLATPAFAAEDSLVQPRFKHIISFGTSITYGDWGIATCSSSVIIDSGYKVTLVLTLQRSSGNDSWSIGLMRARTRGQGTTAGQGLKAQTDAWSLTRLSRQRRLDSDG